MTLANLMAFGLPLALVAFAFWLADRRLPRLKPRTMRRCALDAELAALTHGRPQ